MRAITNVEAVSGSTFEMEVDLTPQLKFYRMKAEHAVKVVIEFDYDMKGYNANRLRMGPYLMKSILSFSTCFFQTIGLKPIRVL